LNAYTVAANQPIDTEIVIASILAWRTRLANNMGVRSYTVSPNNGDVALSFGEVQYHDRTDATASKRPRLNFSFTKVV
jgi:hypothetical protein